MEAQIKDLILSNSTDLFGTEISENSIQFQPTRKDVEGDMTLVVFPFVKLLRCAPEQAGQKIGAFLKKSKLKCHIIYINKWDANFECN